MKQKSFLLLLSLVLIGGMTIASCSKDDDKKGSKNNTGKLAVTGEVIKSGDTWAQVEGFVNNTDKEGNVTTNVKEYGVEYGLNDGNDTPKRKKANGLTESKFTVKLTGLTPNTKYRYRTYVIPNDPEDKETKYGNYKTFTTEEEQPSIVGAWGTGFKESETGYNQTFYFFEDNGYYAKIWAAFDQNKQPKNAFTFDVMKYSIKDNIFYSNNDPIKFTLKKNTLTFENNDKVFKRVDVNEIKMYILSPFDIFPGVWASERIKRNDGTFEEHYIIIDGKAKAADLYVYYKSNGYYDKSYIYYGEWDFDRLIFILDTSHSSNKYMVSFWATRDWLDLSWFDNNNKLQYINLEPVDRKQIQDYIDNAIQL